MDVRVQASILSLIKKLQKKFGIALFLITHDVGVAAEIADHIAVMYAGRIVENGPADRVLYNPLTYLFIPPDNKIVQFISHIIASMINGKVVKTVGSTISINRSPFKRGLE